MNISKKQIFQSNLRSKTSFKKKTFNQTEPFQINELGNCLMHFYIFTFTNHSTYSH